MVGLPLEGSRRWGWLTRTACRWRKARARNARRIAAGTIVDGDVDGAAVTGGKKRYRWHEVFCCAADVSGSGIGAKPCLAKRRRGHGLACCQNRFFLEQFSENGVGFVAGKQ